MDIKKIQSILQELSDKRNWDQFHNPKNLSMALSVEVSELVEIFQWLDNDQSKLENLDQKTINCINDEIADILIYSIRLADKLNIDIENSIYNKINKNKKNYPIELSHSNSTKYNKR